MLWWQTDYEKDALRISASQALEVLCDAMPVAGNYSREQMLRLFRDPEFLVLRTDLLHAYVDKYHVSRGGWSGYLSATLDCDDHRRMFEGDMVRGRWKAGLSAPEAMGPIDYWPMPLAGVERRYHAAEWSISHQDGALCVEVYQTQSGSWRLAGAEVKIAVILGG